MGNVLSGDEKLGNLFSPYERRPRGIVWIDQQFGYRPASKSERKAFERRRSLYYDGRRGGVRRERSQSLGAIIGDLYGYEECGGRGGEERERRRGSYRGLDAQRYNSTKQFIPRIKLGRGMQINEDLQYSSNLDVYSASLRVGENPTTSYRDRLIINEKEGGKATRASYPDVDDLVPDKPDENYFTKNFDECMKRLEIIEKEHEIMEADVGRNAYNLRKPIKRQMTPTAGDTPPPPPPAATDDDDDDDDDDRDAHRQPVKKERERRTEESREEEDEEEREEAKEPSGEENEEAEKKGKAWEKSLQDQEESGAPTDDTCKESTGWYSNLKKQFEERREGGTASTGAASTCRVTGATLKSLATEREDDSGTGAGDGDKQVRHYFSRLVRSNKSLIDEELPDPDKVQNIRAMFQESLNATLRKSADQRRFGGSLQNISARPREAQRERPKSAQGNRDEYRGFRKDSAPADDKVTTATPSTKLPARKVGPATKWTDTTSLSSGVSSDLSSYDTDAECCSREEIEEENTTDEEMREEEEEEKHYVRNETLEKIRSFGTSVTYFGGQMITCSVGPLLSPTTQAILEEIGGKYPDRKSFTRTFEEFYRKYTENNKNELRRRKVVGRTRSFGQNDVFHKPNTLNDTEIEMYKTDLEMEIGIRKPSGRSQGTLKQRLVKCNSAGSRMELFEKEVVEKLNEILEAAVAMSEEEEERKMGEEEEDNEETVTDRQKDEEEKKEETAEEAASNRPQTRESLPQRKTVEADDALFGYEKCRLLHQRKPDMEFERFQVCETVQEKMDRMEEADNNHRITIHVNQSEASTQAKEEEEEGGGGGEMLEEIVINEQEPLDSLEIYLKSRKPESEDTSHRETGTCGDSATTIPSTPEPIIQMTSFANHAKAEESTRPRHQTSRWPIETTVMIDIQKNEEQTPKLVPTGKSMVKTRTRSFKK